MFNGFVSEFYANSLQQQKFTDHKHASQMGHQIISRRNTFIGMCVYEIKNRYSVENLISDPKKNMNK